MVMAEIGFKLGRRPGLDALRGLAVLAVMGRHTGAPLLRGGFLGVDVFFVLSGFLITTVIIEQHVNGLFSFRNFFARRLLRLVPALVALLACVALYAFAVDSPQAAETRSGLLPTLFYVSNWAEALGVNLGVLSHTWSLAVEEQFYLLWPPLLVWSLRLGGFRRAAALAFGVSMGSAILTATRSVAGSDPHDLYIGLESHGTIMLMSGCGLAVWLKGSCQKRLAATARAARIGFPVAVFILLGLFLAVDNTSVFYAFGGYVILAAAVTAVIMHAVLNLDGLAARVFGNRLLIVTGRISYGLYLWHYVVYRIVGEMLPDLGTIPRTLIGVVLSFASASLSYWLIELPFLRLKGRFAVSQPSPSRGAA